MPYLTLTPTENLKLQLSPGLVASYDIQPGNGVGLFWDKHTRLLTYLLAPDPHGAPARPERLVIIIIMRDVGRKGEIVRLCCGHLHF